MTGMDEKPKRRWFRFRLSTWLVLVAGMALVAWAVAITTRHYATEGSSMAAVCPDCLANVGELHELFCLKERCPFCGGQLMTCGCISTVLQLNPDEQKAVDEYVDDEVEPLHGIIERWKAAVNKKGRIPFK